MLLHCYYKCCTKRYDLHTTIQRVIGTYAIGFYGFRVCFSYHPPVYPHTHPSLLCRFLYLDVYEYVRVVACAITSYTRTSRRTYYMCLYLYIRDLPPSIWTHTRCRIIIMSCLHGAHIISYIIRVSIYTKIHAGMRKQIFYPQWKSDTARFSVVSRL